MMSNNFKVSYTRDGNDSYRSFQKPFDLIRALFNGRYKFTQDGNEVTVSKRYGFGKDRLLKESDFEGVLDKDNKRLLRAMHRYFQRLEKKGKSNPDKMNFYVGDYDPDKYIHPSDAIESANEMFDRIPYAESGKNIPNEKKSKKWLKIAGLSSFPLAAGALLSYGTGNNELGTALAALSASGGTAGLYGWGSAANSDTYVNVRRNMNGVERGFVNETGKSKSKKAYVIQSDAKNFRIETPVIGQPKHVPSISDKEILFKTITARSDKALRKKIDRFEKGIHQK